MIYFISFEIYNLQKYYYNLLYDKKESESNRLGIINDYARWDR